MSVKPNLEDSAELDLLFSSFLVRDLPSRELDVHDLRCLGYVRPWEW